ncbi:hypothetical protein E2562_036007 [Oryza meyeriana var. granulata]|uniref:Uncharacterized protein n=1 Tax=Oryza meyeriana var. granulata TaxID=110450 RepID=A0A6G1CX03_9ORYZ|nr:hypothetical protein E2562_036007 [Oryza meyeriana var. granulata]
MKRRRRKADWCAGGAKQGAPRLEAGLPGQRREWEGVWLRCGGRGSGEGGVVKNERWPKALDQVLELSLDGARFGGGERGAVGYL